MKNNKKIAELVFVALPLMAQLGGAVESVAVAPLDVKPKTLSASVDNNGDVAFASDLKGAEELLAGLSREKKMTPKQSGEYLAREVERAQKFFAFAKSTLIPHSAQLAQKMRDPDGMINEGRFMVENAPDSWQGYDYMASGYMMKRDMDQALENFDKALAAAPDMQKDWYRYMMATCYNAKKDPDKALSLYDGIIAANDNWIAVKNSYMRASLILIGRDNGKAADYFDKGMLLASRAEMDALYKAGVCGKFQGLGKWPEACSAAAKL